MKILVVRFSSIGDVVLTTPIVRCLKQQIPNCEIHFITKKAFKGILEHNSNISKIFTIDSSISEVIATLKAILEISEQIQTINRYLQFALDKKLNVNMAPLIAEYNKALACLEKWLKDQKKCINNYRAESAKLNPKPNFTYKNIERNMYIEVITGQLNGELKGDHWQTICDANKQFRPRLVVCALIAQNDFVDNWGEDTGWKDELKRLYAQKTVPVL